MSRTRHVRGPGKCWNCGHAVSAHSTGYPMGHLVGVPEADRPAKKPDEGCSVPGCKCRRWFEDWTRRPNSSTPDVTPEGD